MQGMSEREYAARVGLSRGAIQKAKSAGRLVLHDDGSIDPARSDARRTTSTDPAKSRPAPQASVKPVPDAALSAVGDTLREQGLSAPASGGGTTFLQGRGLQPLLAGFRADVRRRDGPGQEAVAWRAAMTVAVSTFKSETYRFLSLFRPTDEERNDGVVDPAGTIHLPQWTNSEWIRQLVAEQRTVVKTRRGFQKLEWQKMRERNEALDCRVYARAAARILGADRWQEKVWQELERQFPAVEPVRTPAGNHDDQLTPHAVRVRKRRRRTVRRSSWMG